MASYKLNQMPRVKPLPLFKQMLWLAILLQLLSIILGNGAALDLTSKNGSALTAAGNDTTVVLEAQNPSIQFNSVGNNLSNKGVGSAYAQLNGRGMTLGSTADTVNVNLMPGGKAAVMANAKTGNVGIGNVNDEFYKLKVFADDKGLDIENAATGHDWELWVNNSGQLVMYNDQLAPGTPAGVFDVTGVYTASD